MLAPPLLFSCGYARMFAICHTPCTGSLTLAVADACDPTILALAPKAIMLAYGRYATLLALALDACVVAASPGCSHPPAYIALGVPLVAHAVTI